MSKILKPPIQSELDGPSVFLSGTVDMGTAADWRSPLTSLLSHQRITIINPLRDNWDESWKQDISNPEFKGQVAWELDYMEQADLIAIYLAPRSQSPVSMLEFGLHAKGGKVVVCCPEGFGRRGNIQIVCERFGIPLVATIEELAELIIKKIGTGV
jgi:hypothetical protein